MALVNLLRFNEDCGAAVSDEEYWNIYFRRRMYCDNLHSLLDDATASAWGMEVMYGGMGYPALHHEVVSDTQAMLAARLAAVERKEAPKPETVKEIARMAFDELRKALRRRIDDKLRFFYGVDTADVNSGTVSKDGKTFPIAPPKVLKTLRTFVGGEKKDPLLRSAFEAKAVVFGFDSAVGMTAYHLSPDKYICGYVHEGFECLGTGKYASGLSLGKDFRTRTLMMRKKGYPRAEGLYELLAASVLAKDHFKEVGGNMNIVLIDRNGRTREERYREVFDDRARMAGEIVKARLAERITRENAIGLLDDLIFKQEDLDDVEAALFAKGGDEAYLRLALRGYKLREIPEMLKGRTSRSKKRTSAKAKGGGK